MRARGQLVGAIAIEHRHARHYAERDSRIIEGLGDVLALTVDNARSFGRLRTLAAEEERSRIARDLHDRLGQWLSYISFELERIITSSEEGSEELDRLYSDVQTAIDELRETLRQLRSGVTDDRSLAVVAEELVERFNQRGDDGRHTSTSPPPTRACRCGSRTSCCGSCRRVSRTSPNTPGPTGRGHLGRRRRRGPPDDPPTTAGASTRPRACGTPPTGSSACGSAPT